MQMGPIITQFSSNMSNIDKCPPVTIMFSASSGNKIHSTEPQNFPILTYGSRNDLTNNKYLDTVCSLIRSSLNV